MKAAIVAAIGALALASCASMPPPSIDRLQAGYERLQRAAEPLLPLLPAEREVRARAILAALGMAIDAARAATDAGQRTAAIARADAQLKALDRAMAR